MAFSQKTNSVINQIKSNLKFILIGVAVIALLTFGFLVAIGIIAAFIIIIPIARFWQSYKMKQKGGKNKSHDIDDFIDVDYEIIEQNEKRKK
jgi:uncharacterized oligopeptide transporter (OPT) family protein